MDFLKITLRFDKADLEKIDSVGILSGFIIAHRFKDDFGLSK